MSAVVLTHSRCSVKAECTQKSLHYCLRHSLELRAVGQHQTSFQTGLIRELRFTECLQQSAGIKSMSRLQEPNSGFTS